MKIMFTLPAKEYGVENAKDNDLVDVLLDLKEKMAEYVWYPREENPSNYPYEEDDFEGVLELWNKLGNPVDNAFELAVEIAIPFLKENKINKEEAPVLYEKITNAIPDFILKNFSEREKEKFKKFIYEYSS